MAYSVKKKYSFIAYLQLSGAASRLVLFNIQLFRRHLILTEMKLKNELAKITQQRTSYHLLSPKSFRRIKLWSMKQTIIQYIHLELEKYICIYVEIYQSKAHSGPLNGWEYKITMDMHWNSAKITYFNDGFQSWAFVNTVMKLSVSLKYVIFCYLNEHLSRSHIHAPHQQHCNRRR